MYVHCVNWEFEMVDARNYLTWSSTDETACVMSTILWIQTTVEPNSPVTMVTGLRSGGQETRDWNPDRDFSLLRNYIPLNVLFSGTRGAFSRDKSAHV
jgi:hypothetical protein